MEKKPGPQMKKERGTHFTRMEEWGTNPGNPGNPVTPNRWIKRQEAG
jgi:hypothetical protein